MWLLAEYQATALFSLKPAWATSSGGRTLLVPTPFAIKMALLDVACRTDGVEIGKAAWEGWLRDLPVAIRPARQVVVSNTFTKILKPRRNPAEPGTADAGPFQKTIGYREYAYLDGALGIALDVQDKANTKKLIEWLAGINYFGKRGGFMQLLRVPTPAESLSDNYIRIEQNADLMRFPSLMQQLDECGSDLTFQRVSIYTGDPIALKDTQRRLISIALPYRVRGSSRGYTWYELDDQRGAS